MINAPYALMFNLNALLVENHKLWRCFIHVLVEMLNSLQLSGTPEYWEFSRDFIGTQRKIKVKIFSDIFWRHPKESYDSFGCQGTLCTYLFVFIIFEKEKAIKDIIMIHGRLADK
jgi:hypothetical protein